MLVIYSGAQMLTAAMEILVLIAHTQTHTHTHNILVHIFQPPVSNHPKCADLGVAYAGAGSFQEDILIHLLLLRKIISFRQFLSSDMCGSTFLLKVLHICSE